MKSRFHLQTKLATVVLVIMLFCIVLSTIISLISLRSVVEERLNSNGVFVAETFSTFCVENLLAWDYPALQHSLEHAAVYDPYLLGIEIYHQATPQHESRLVAKYDKEGDEEVGVPFTAPVYVSPLGEKQEIGQVTIHVSHKKYSAFYFQQILSLLILSLILGFGDTLLIYVAVKKMMLAPIGRIEEGVTIISNGNLNYRLPVESKDEIGRLAYTFNKMTENLQAMHEREKLISKMKSEFISIAAHQLRTPLSAIKWSLDMILDGQMGKISQSAEECLAKTYESNERLVELMNAFLSSAQIEEGRYLFDMIDIDIEDFLKDVVQYSNTLALKQKITIKLDITKFDYPKIHVDKEKFGVAIQNLINNSIKYSNVGSEVIVSLKPCVEKETECLLIEVKDFGIGIGEKDYEKMFTKFFRSNEARSFHVEGSGLGLFITKNIIEAHCGKIWFTSKKNQGTSFFIRLPLQITNPCTTCFGDTCRVLKT